MSALNIAPNDDVQIIESAQEKEKEVQNHTEQPPTDETTRRLPTRSGLKPIIARQPFSRIEDELILQYLVHHKCYERLRVMLVWKSMSQYFNNGRSAEALRERFRRYVINEIYKFTNITNDEKNLITVGFAKNVQTRKR